MVTLSTNSFTNAQTNREQVQTLLNEGIEQIYLVSGTEDAVGGLRLCEEAKAHCATWGGAVGADGRGSDGEYEREFEQMLADLASEKIALPESTAHPGYR